MGAIALGTVLRNVDWPTTALPLDLGFKFFQLQASYIDPIWLVILLAPP